MPPLVKPVFILVVATVRLYREGLVDVLARAGFSVRGAPPESQETLVCLQEMAPDVILLDVTCPPNPALIHHLVRNPKHVPVVAVGVGDSEAEIVALAETGIVGYVTHGASVDELAQAIETASRGELICSPRLAAALVRRLATLAADHEPQLQEPIDLTRREREIAALLRYDLSNKEIATQLCIEVTTVKNHVHNLLEKLNVSRRREAAALLNRKHRAINSAPASVGG